MTPSIVWCYHGETRWRQPLIGHRQFVVIIVTHRRRLTIMTCMTVQSWRSKRRPKSSVRAALGVSALTPTVTTLLPPPSQMPMSSRRWTWSRAHRLMKGQQATMKQARTQPSSLSHLGLLPTMGLAETPLGRQKTPILLAFMIPGGLLQVAHHTQCPAVLQTVKGLHPL